MLDSNFQIFNEMASRPISKLNKTELRAEMEMRNLEIGGSMTKAQMIEAIQISDSEKFDKEIEAHEHEIESLNASLGRLNRQPVFAEPTPMSHHGSNDERPSIRMRSNNSRVRELEIEFELEKLRILQIEIDRKFKNEQLERDRSLEYEKLKYQERDKQREFEEKEKQRESRGERKTKRRTRQREADERERDRQFQLELKKVELASKANKDNVQGHPNSDINNSSKLIPHQGANEDVLEYFVLFEKTAELHNINKDQWHLIISGKFNEKTRHIFKRLSIADMQSYDKIKEELMKHFKMSPLTHYLKFRSIEKVPNETFNQFANRLTEIFNLYLESKSITTFEGLHDDIILQKFLETLRGNIRRYVMDKSSKHSGRGY